MTPRRAFPKPHAMEWACLVVGAVLAFHYCWILDDAYIYYRYIDNLVVHGRGLVFNEGEFVEGFSSPAWAVLLAALRWLGVSYWTTTKVAAVAAFVVFWWILVVANRRLSEGEPRPYIVNFPLIHLTLNYGVLSYCSSGLETPMLVVVSAAYACFFLVPQSRALHIAVGLAPLIRHELALPYAIAFLWFWFRHKKFPLMLFTTCLLTLGSWLVFRVYYYADLFPNTFYLKDETAIGQGLLYLYDTFVAYHSLAIGAGLVLCYALLRRRDPDHDYRPRERAVMLLAAGLVAVYVIKIGGDPRHFRYLIFPYCVAFIAAGGLVERLLVKLSLHQQRPAVLAGSAVVALFTLTCYPRQLIDHPVLQRFDGLAKELYRGDGFRSVSFLEISDSAIHRLTVETTPDLASNDLEPNKAPLPLQPIGSTFNCVSAYHRFNQQVIHQLALTEPFLARMNAPPTARDRTAHKWGLVPLAKQITAVRRAHGFGKGAFERAVRAGNAPPWVQDNLETIRAIEARAYNEHDFWANLGSALTPTGRIDPE